MLLIWLIVWRSGKDQDNERQALGKMESEEAVVANLGRVSLAVGRHWNGRRSVEAWCWIKGKVQSLSRDGVLW